MNNISQILNKLDEVDIKLALIKDNEITDILMELTLALDLITEQLQILSKNTICFLQYFLLKISTLWDKRKN